MNRTFTRILRWSLLPIVPWTAFWIWFYARNGYIPSTDTMGIWYDGWALLKLPFGVSRLFDVFAIPTWFALLIICWERIKDADYSFWAWIALWAFVSAFFGLIDALVMGIPTGLTATLLTTFAFGVCTLVGYCLNWLFKWANNPN